MEDGSNITKRATKPKIARANEEVTPAGPLACLMGTEAFHPRTDVHTDHLELQRELSRMYIPSLIREEQDLLMQQEEILPLRNSHRGHGSSAERTRNLSEGHRF
jgi:hypothetical protein